MPNKRDSEKELLSLWVHRDFAEWLRREAKRRGVSKSELIKKALRKWYYEGALKGEGGDEP